MIKPQILFFVVVLLAIVVGVVLSEPVVFGLCNEEDRFSCRGPLTTTGQPLFLMSLATSLALLVLLFLPARFFYAWLKYSAWTIPLGAMWIIFTPVSCGNPLGVCLDKELATWYASGLVLVASAAVIIWQALRHKPPTVGPR